MSASELRVLFSQYAQQLERYLNYKISDPQLAADIVQESFLRLAERLAQPGDEIKDQKAWLFRTANNLLLDSLRHQKRWQKAPLDEVDDLLADIAASPDSTAITRQQLAQVGEVLASLPGRTRSIFHLHRLENMTQADIARELGISLSTVEKHLASALAAMLKQRSS